MPSTFKGFPSSLPVIGDSGNEGSLSGRCVYASFKRAWMECRPKQLYAKFSVNIVYYHNLHIQLSINLARTQRESRPTLGNRLSPTSGYMLTRTCVVFVLPPPRRPPKEEPVIGVGRQRHALDQRELLRPPISPVRRRRPGRHRLPRGSEPVRAVHGGAISSSI